MEDIKVIIGKNLAELRKRKKYTQLDLANILGYSDKAISKWEKGDSLPDIEVLYNICNLYGVTLDYLTHEGSYKDKKEFISSNKKYTRNKKIITCLSSITVWFIAVILFSSVLMYSNVGYWPIFTWSLPITCIVLLVFNCIWGQKPLRFLIISFLVWTLIAGAFLQFIYYNINIWPVFLVGIPSQIAVILWSGLKKHKN